MTAFVLSDKSRFWRLNFIAVGVGAATGYWLLESLLHSNYWDSIPFWQSLQGEHDSNELFMRFVIVIILLIFGYAAEKTKQHYMGLSSKYIKIDRLLRFLSECNQNVQRQTEENALFDAACKAAVEVGEFSFAWIGMNRGDDFELAAWASMDPLLCEEIKVGRLQDYASLIRCLGCQQVLKKGISVLCEISEKMDCAAPWKENFLNNGCRHAVALPLKIGEKTVGVFEVYAGEGGKVGEDELSILNEIAGDISVALTNFEYTEQQRRATKALRESEAQKSAIISSALDGIISMDCTGRVIEFNPAAEEMFGYKRSEAIGELLSEKIIPPNMRKKHHAGLKHYLESGEGSIIGTCIEVSAMHADGHEFPTEMCIALVQDTEPAIFTAIIRNITKRQKAEHELRNKLEELERFQKATVRREFRIKELRDEIKALKSGEGYNGQ